METVLPSYYDPLFSLLIIVSIAFVVALTTYGWGLYKKQRESGKVLKFLEKFNSAECALDTTNMAYEKEMFKPLTLLASAFENSGEYQKAISLYNYLIRHTGKEEGQFELMERLGNTYLHAGLLERARTIYLEILRNTPRNEKVLSELGIVYEMTQEYDKASEILEPLSLLDEDTTELSNFLEYSRIITSKTLLPAEKREKLLEILALDSRYYRPVLGALFTLDTHKAWELVEKGDVRNVLDILWRLPASQVDFDIIAKNVTLQTLYYASGQTSKAPNEASGIFALDMLSTAKKGNYTKGDLLFSYLCNKCKQSFPVPFLRCPKCMTLHSLELKEKLTYGKPQTNHSLL